MEIKKFTIITLYLLLNIQNSIAQNEMPFPVSMPEQQNIDSQILTRMDVEIADGQHGKIDGLIIVRNGHLVFEKYYNDYLRNDLHYLASATKTITSALIGIAIDQGHIKGVHEYMLDFFPEYTDIQNNDSLKQSITLKHLLTMTAGFRYDMGVTSNDRLKYKLDLPIINTPGVVWAYSNDSSIILSAIIRNRTGMSAEAFADAYLFNPIGISQWSWQEGDNDLTQTSGGLMLRPLDMAVFGQLYLNEGEWKGNQIVPKEWIEESVQVYVDSAKTNRSYGYHLWQFRDDSEIANSMKTNDLYFASGAGSQKIYIIPHLKCVIVFTCNSADTETVLENFIFPAIQGNHANIESIAPDKPRTPHVSLTQNFPNPFNPVTSIKYNLNQTSHVTLKIYNQSGQEIETLVNKFQKAGEYEISWFPNGLTSGIYFYRIQSIDASTGIGHLFSETKKLIYQK